MHVRTATMTDEQFALFLQSHPVSGGQDNTIAGTGQTYDELIAAGYTPADISTLTDTSSSGGGGFVGPPVNAGGGSSGGAISGSGDWFQALGNALTSAAKAAATIYSATQTPAR